jgi:hypothetical protein
MTKTLHGKAHGKTIELDEDLGVPEGQEVEVQVTVVPSVAPPMAEGLAKVYAVLGERFNSGESDVAARHNEHQQAVPGTAGTRSVLRNAPRHLGDAYSSRTHSSFRRGSGSPTAATS